MGILDTLKGISKTLWREIDGQDSGSFSIKNSSGFRKLSRYELLNEYRGVVYSCITVIADDVGKYEPIFYRTGTNGEDVKVRNHPLQKVLQNPNPKMSQYDFFWHTQAYLELTGEAFWYVAVGQTTRTPKELYIVRPDKMRLVLDGGEVTGYVVSRDDGTQIPLELDEVIHIKNFNPYDENRGMGTVQAGLLYIDTEYSTSLFQRNYMRNQGTPSGVLTLNGNVSPETFKKIKAKWAEQTSGLDNAGKTLFIRKMDAAFTKLGVDIGDIDMSALKKLSAEDVRKMFRVPNALLGATDESGMGRANFEAVEYIFSKRTIDPKLNKFDDALDLALNNYYDDTETRVKHVSQVPEDDEAILNENDKAVGRWKTINEIRKEQGLPEVQGGNQLYYGFNQVPIDAPAESDRSEKTIRVKLKVKNDQFQNHSHDHSHSVARKDAADDAFFRGLVVLENRLELKYKRKMRSLLNEQRDQVLSVIGGTNRGLAKAFEEAMPVEGAVAKEWTEIFEALLIPAMELIGKYGVDKLGEPDQVFVLDQATRRIVFNSTERLMRSFNKQTVQKLQKQLAEGLTNNETPEQLKKRVELVYGEAKGFRAERIANTESHKATNYAISESYRQSGYKKMRWRARVDACEFCMAMNGREVTIGQPFVPVGSTITGTDGGEYLNDYDDIKYADAHPNCKCYLEPIR